MQLLNASNVSLSLGNQSVIEQMNVHVNTGEFVGLIGPNGAGKSSLLRVLAGLVKPKIGQTHLAPQDTLIALQDIPAQTRALTWTTAPRSTPPPNAPPAALKPPSS